MSDGFEVVVGTSRSIRCRQARLGEELLTEAASFKKRQRAINRGEDLQNLQSTQKDVN